jgi:hypothetical protein
VPVSISTPETPDQVVSTLYTATRDQGQRLTLLEAPGLVTGFSWTNPSPGAWTIGAKLTFLSGEIVSRGASIRVSPANANFTNATALTGGQGVFQPTLMGLTGSGGMPLGTVWYRFTAETNGYFVISTTNLSSGIDLQVSTGVSTNSLVVAPQIGNLSQRGWMAVKITNGTTYNLRFIGYVGAQLPPLTYQVVHPPANDLFENAELLSGEHFVMHNMTVFATNQPGEPVHFGTSAQRSLWWKWVSPGKGWVAVTGRAKVYTGDSLTALTALPATALVISNTICMVAYDAGSSTALYSDWKLDFNSTPPNDDFANATPLSGRRVTLKADLAYATQESGEALVFPEGWNYGHTVWFTWVPPRSGQALVRRLAGAAYAKINLFRGADLAGLICLQQDGYVPFEVQGGEPLHICVDHNGGGPDATTLEIALNVPPENDDFDKAVTLTEAVPSVGSWNFGATRQYGEPNHNGQFGGRSVWFRWIAQAAGHAEVSLSGDIATNMLAVYEGATLNGLIPIAASTSALTNSASFQAVAGHTYQIAVDGAYGASGDFTLTLQGPGSSIIAEIKSVGLMNGKLILSLRPGTVACKLQRSEDLSTWEDVGSIEATVTQVELPIDSAHAFFRLAQP